MSLICCNGNVGIFGPFLLKDTVRNGPHTQLPRVKVCELGIWFIPSANKLLTYYWEG